MGFHYIAARASDRDDGVRLEMRICTVKKTCMLINLTTTSLHMRTGKGKASSMVTIWSGGWPLSFVWAPIAWCPQ
jgi:hypothetical protein